MIVQTTTHKWRMKNKHDQRAAANLFSLFTQPPSGRRRLRICFADVFFVFFVFFSVSQRYETTVLGNGWTDFHETFTKRYRGKCILKRRAPAWRKSNAAWRMANVDALRNLRYDSGGLTRGRHARRLRYTERANGCNLVFLFEYLVVPVPSDSEKDLGIVVTDNGKSS